MEAPGFLDGIMRRRVELKAAGMGRKTMIENIKKGPPRKEEKEREGEASGGFEKQENKNPYFG